MGFNFSSFNPDDHPDEFQPFPAGWYTAMIVKQEMKATKTGGEMLSLEFDIIDGEHKGRKVFTNLNLVNSNATAVKIAQVELANICKALGGLRPRDSSELLFKPMKIRVTVAPEKDGYPARNEVKGYAQIEAQAQEKPAQQAQPAKAWERPSPKADVPIF